MQAKIFKALSLFIITAFALINIQDYSISNVVASTDSQKIKLQDDAYPPPPTSLPIEIKEEPQDDLSEYAQLAIDYIAKKENISPDQLIVYHETSYSSEILGNTYQSIDVIDNKGLNIFKLDIDILNYEVLEYGELISRESIETSRKYGKFESSLYNKILNLNENDIITVSFLIRDPEGGLYLRKEKANKILSEKYPEVRMALEKGDTFRDIADEKILYEVLEDYEYIISGDLPQLINPLVDSIKEDALDIHTYKYLPLVTVRLPVNLLLKTVSREDVQFIFNYTEAKSIEATDISRIVNRVPAVWQRGFNGGGAGSGIRVSVLETDHFDYSSTSTNCSSGRNCFYRDSLKREDIPYIPGEHATLVASILASNHQLYKGIAPGAQLISTPIGGSGGIIKMVETLEWALSLTGAKADIVTQSVIFCAQVQPEDEYIWADWAYDYLSNYHDKSIVVAAGNKIVNNNECIADGVVTPGRAYNVITVGAYNDKNTISWSDDSMRATSNWRNPRFISPQIGGGHEKPEIVAPGENIKTIGLNGQIQEASGTSLAAPQVAGLAALLMDRAPTLKNKPAALKAIIMASATHNISGGVGILPGTDGVDGAGAINADLADLTAYQQKYHNQVCQKSCWWHDAISSGSFNTSSSNQTPYRSYLFEGRSGDRVRIAASWMTYAYCLSITNQECDQAYTTDLDMSVIDPNGNFLAASASRRNSFEMLPHNNDLILPMNGVYEIRIFNHYFNSNSKQFTNQLGVAITHMPYTVGTYDAQHHASAGPTMYMPSGGTSSGWGTMSAADAAWQTLTYTGNIDHRAIFNFNGDRISLLYSMANNRGFYKVLIDGVERAYFNGYAPETRRQVIRTWSGLSAGDHTIEVIAWGGGLMEVDAFAVDQEHIIYTGTIDNTNSLMRFIGSWEALSNVTTPPPGAFNGTMSRSRIANNVFRLTFQGTKVTWIYSKDYTRGRAAVTIDGVNRGEFNLFTNSTQRQQEITFSNLSPGIHTIHITVLGTTSCYNASYCDTMIDVDAIRVE